jgi:hypothetical protein
MLFNFIPRKVEVYVYLLFCTTEVNFCYLCLVIAKQPNIMYVFTEFSCLQLDHVSDPRCWSFHSPKFS